MSIILTIAFAPVVYTALCFAQVAGRVLVKWEKGLDGDAKFSTINRIGKYLPKPLRSELYKFYRVGRRLRAK